MIKRACSADTATPGPLYDHPNAPTYYPSDHFLRVLLMVRAGDGGVPEVVTA